MLRYIRIANEAATRESGALTGYVRLKAMIGGPAIFNFQRAAASFLDGPERRAFGL